MINEKTKFNLLKKYRSIKIFFSIIGAVSLTLIVTAAIFIFITNEKLPKDLTSIDEKKEMAAAKAAIGYENLLKKDQLHFTYNEHSYTWQLPQKLIKMQYNSRGNDIDAHYDIQKSQFKIWLNKIELKDHRLLEKYIILSKRYLFNDIFWLQPMLLPALQGEKIQISLKKMMNQDRFYLLEFQDEKKTIAHYLVQFNQQWLVEKVRIWREDIPLKGVIAQFNLYQNSAKTEKNFVLFAQERILWHLTMPAMKISIE